MSRAGGKPKEIKPHTAHIESDHSRLNFLDLFCGCGGFTLGMLRAGFHCLAAIDNDEIAIEVLRRNLPQVNLALAKDLTRFGPEHLAEHIGSSPVHVIVGGPPCQGFSTARQVDGSNHGRRLKQDPRRHLYREFLRFVDHFQPLVFVIENVPGLRSAAGGEYFTHVQHEARTLGRDAGKPGYRVHAQMEDATRLGVPQKRRRQLIVGVRNDLATFFPAELDGQNGARDGLGRLAPTMVRALNRLHAPPLGLAIGDLPPLSAGEGENSRDYDLSRRASHRRRYGKRADDYLSRVLEVHKARSLTNHVARPHNERDLGDFKKLREGESSAVAMRRGVQFDFPYDKSSFKDRYTRQSNARPCSTIVAHLSKDGLMFIHPTQNRSLTPREAARVQTFPDWFEFPEARTHAFRVIGNAVPPLVGRAIGDAIGIFLKSQAGNAQRHGGACQSCTKAAEAAVGRVLHMTRAELRRLPKHELLAAWYAILLLMPDLHPENARDHGVVKVSVPTSRRVPSDLRPLSEVRHARSGWPASLTGVGEEAWRRVEVGELSAKELYRAPEQHFHDARLTTQR
jgi:DNA (cytosine-5)-methyltransferase 1